MSHKFVVALILMAFVLVCMPVLAQEAEPEAMPKTEQEKSFKLLRDSGSAESELELDEEAGIIWEPHLEGGTIEVSFSLGFLNLNQKMLGHDQIIYKYTAEATYWGDMEITGKTAFNPTLRLGYNLTPWLSLESVGGLFFADYTSTLVNRKRRPNEPDAPVDFEEPELGEFDAEERSLNGGNLSLNAIFYPLNLGDAGGRFHPYATAGAGRMWYSMNSNYTDGPASGTDINYGGGLRFLFDKNISLRLEFVFHSNEMEFTPTEFFAILDEGTTRVPLNEYPVVDDHYTERPVEEFDSNSITSLNWSIGIQGTF